MAKPQTFSSDYKNARQMTAQMNETNDCGVVALTILTGKSYAEVHAALAAAGRKHRKGTYYHQFEKAIEALGFNLKKWEYMDLLDVKRTYPMPHCNLAHVTVNHVRRFPKSWAVHKDKLLLIFSTNHVSAYKDGAVHDWADGKAKRVMYVWEITPR